MMRSSWCWWFASLLSLAACLDIERTPVAASGGAGGLSSGAGNEGGVPADFQPMPCVQQCLDITPAGTRAFAAVAVCTEDARANACADACSGAGSDDPGEATCSAPGNVDMIPSCNICLKQRCCDALSRCISEIACLTVAICASGCE